MKAVPPAQAEPGWDWQSSNTSLPDTGGGWRYAVNWTGGVSSSVIFLQNAGCPNKPGRSTPLRSSTAADLVHFRFHGGKTGMAHVSAHNHVHHMFSNILGVVTYSL